MADESRVVSGDIGQSASSYFWLRRAASWCYWRLAGLLYSFGGTWIYERKWAEYGMSRDSIRTVSLQPHRRWLMDAFERLDQFDSVLEVGCGRAVNLQLLCEALRLRRVCGIDINEPSIKEATIRMKSLGFANAEFYVGKADDLSRFGDRSIDVVFSDATCLYIGPDKIRRVLSECVRVARKTVFLLELHVPGLAGKCVHTPDGWVRDYQMTLRDVVGDSSITLLKVPPSAWPSGRWPQFGHLIQIDIGLRPSH